MEYGKIKPAGGRGTSHSLNRKTTTYQGGNVYETHQQENHCNEHGNHDGRKRRLPHQRPDIHCGRSPFRKDRRQRRTPGQQKQKRPGLLSLPLRRTSGPPAYRRRMPAAASSGSTQSPTSAPASEADTELTKQVQQALNDKGYDCGTPDGITGEKTRTALIKFQEDNNLTADGIIGEEVKTALGI